jgi:hypothetical protein
MIMEDTLKYLPNIKTFISKFNKPYNSIHEDKLTKTLSQEELCR